MRDPAPVAVFAYKRPDHLTRCLSALRENEVACRCSVTIFCDGPRQAGDLRDVELTRQVAHSASGFGELRVIESSTNQGLSGSVIKGVSNMLEEVDSVVVLEDDLIVSPDFLLYMNQGLSLYENNRSVIGIHGYLPNIDEDLPQSFFLRGADCWGWATWRRGWDELNVNGDHLLEQIEKNELENAFDMDGAFPYTDMLRAQVRGEIDSWAIRWYASAFLAGLYTLHPGRSLVENIGLDGSGTHKGSHAALLAKARRLDLPLERVVVDEVPRIRAAYQRALAEKSSVFMRLWRKIPFA